MERNIGISGLLAGALLLGLSAGGAAAEHKGKGKAKGHDKARTTTHVVSKHKKVAGYEKDHRGHAYAYGHNTPKPGRRASNDDFDRDGIPNHRDRDDDNDGIIDSRDRYDWSSPRVRAAPDWRHDLDRDGIADSRDRDIDNDGHINSRDKYPRNPRRH